MIEVPTRAWPIKNIRRWLGGLASGLLMFAAAALLLAVVPVFGNTALIVRSGSMQPAIGVGDLVIVRSSEGYSVGDVIAFKSANADDVIITHRIVEVTEGGFVTQGDANDAVDEAAVTADRIVGREILTLPYIGQALAFGKTRFGFLAFIVLPALLVIAGDVRVIWGEVRGRRQTPSNSPLSGGELVSSSALLFVAPVLTAPSDDQNESMLAPWANASPDKGRVGGVSAPPRLYLDSAMAKVLLLVFSVSLTVPSGLAFYSDSEVSSGNTFTAAADFSVGPGDVVINEVMWMGSIGSQNDEWIELRNTTTSTVDISGWEIVGAGSGSSSVVITSGSIPPNGFYLISNFDSDHASSAVRNSIVVDLQESNVGLDNVGGQLVLRDAADAVIDSTSTGAWPAGFHDANTL